MSQLTFRPRPSWACRRHCTARSFSEATDFAGRTNDLGRTPRHAPDTHGEGGCREEGAPAPSSLHQSTNSRPLSPAGTRHNLVNAPITCNCHEPTTHRNAMPVNSRGLSEAIPTDHTHNPTAPRSGAGPHPQQRRTTRQNTPPPHAHHSPRRAASPHNSSYSLIARSTSTNASQSPRSTTSSTGTHFSCSCRAVVLNATISAAYVLAGNCQNQH